MRALSSLFVVALLFACPAPSGHDGGTGGGFVFGGGTGFFGGGTGSTGGGTGTETPDSYCGFFSGAGACAVVTSCGFFTDAQQCATYYQTHVSTYDLCGAVHALLDSGTVLFNPQAAAECKAAYSQCDFSLTACGAVFTGVAGNGADCDSSVPCQPGYYCAGDGTCPGHCAPLQPGGAIVEYPGACAESTWARRETLADGGSHYVCSAKVALGQPCTTSSACTAPAFCDATSGTCQAPGGEGTPCSPAAMYSSQCTPILVLMCQPQLDGGARCAPRARRGEPCGFCVSDLRCVPVDGGVLGVCGDLAAQGESCVTAAECVTGALTCEGGQCVPLPGEGGSCRDSYQCAAGLTCRYSYIDGGAVVRCEHFDGGVAAPTCPHTESP